MIYLLALIIVYAMCAEPSTKWADEMDKDQENKN